MNRLEFFINSFQPFILEMSRVSFSPGFQYFYANVVSILGQAIARITLIFSKSCMNFDPMPDSPESKIHKEVSETSTYPFTAVNTIVLNKIQSLSAGCSQWFTVDMNYHPGRLVWYPAIEMEPINSDLKPNSPSVLFYKPCFTNCIKL